MYNDGQIPSGHLHRLVHFQSCTLFVLQFPQAILNELEGIEKELGMFDKK